MPQDLTNSWKAFSAFCYLWRHFPAKSCWDAWRSGSRLARGQVNMVDQTKLHSPTRQLLKHWLCDMQAGLTVEKWALCVDQCPLQALQFSVHLINFLHTSPMWWFHWDSENCSGSDGQQTTKQWQWPFFWSKFGFGKCFGASPPSNHWTGHPWLSYKIHFSSHITIRCRNGSLLLCRIREERKCESHLVTSDSLQLMDIQSMEFSRPEY